MSRPDNRENLQSLQDTIVWAASEYGVVTGTVVENIDVTALGKNPTNPPAEGFIDNVYVMVFTVGTDKVHKNLVKPASYQGTGGLKISYVWTNDGGVDDEDKNVKGQITYKTTTVGDSVSGNTGTLSVEDTYTSALGYIEHKSGYMTIPHADLDGKDCIYIQFSFETPAGAALTCDPRLIGICITYEGRTLA